MLPEKELIKSEITIRLLALDTSTKLSKDALVRWLSLTLGLISPNETRTSFIKLLDKLIESHFKGGITMDDLIEYGKKQGIAEKTVYYHIARLKKLGLVSKVSNKYVMGDGFERDLSKIILKAYKKQMEEVYTLIEEAIRAIEQFYED